MMPGMGMGMPQQNAAANGAAASAPADTGKTVNLNDKINKAECYARNVSSQFPISNLFIGDTRLGCQSDADEQLILYIEFQEFVKLSSIQLTEFNGGNDPELNPTTVHVFANRCNLGFEDADDVPPTQSFELSAEDLRESSDPLPLRMVKFTRVKSITIYIEDNAGGSVSALGALKFFGRTVFTTNMNDFKSSG